MSSRPSKRRRVELSLEDKIKLIKESESFPKPTLKVLGENYSIGKSTVSDIIKKKSVLIAQWENNPSGGKFRFNNNCKYDKVNDMVWDWFTKARGKNIPISGVLIQEKASEYSKEIGLTEFKASNGWLNRWKARHSVKGFKVCGESAGVNTETVEDYKKRLPDISCGYQPQDIFNCDETGLYFRALPDRMLSVKGQSTKGTKTSKNRVTVLLACSATGEKLRPLVIGKSLNPRCLKNVKRDTLGVDYYANKRSWMNSTLFMTWLNGVNRDMQRQGRHILMFLDNASSHGHIQLSNVTLKFFPPNTTSHLQPLDQGIICAFKALYRKNLLRSLLSAIDSVDSVQQLCKKVTVLDAIVWIVKAWESVKVTTIMGCFELAGFCRPCDTLYDDTVDDDDDVPIATLIQLAKFDLTTSELQHMDDDIDTEDNSEQWEQAILKEHTLEAEISEEEDEDSEPLPGIELTLKDILEFSVKLKNFSTEIDPRYLKYAQDLKSMTEVNIVDKLCKKRQTTIDSFFVPSDCVPCAEK